MKRIAKKKPQQPKRPRTHRVSFVLNDDELKAVNRYMAKYKISNKSHLYREVILTHVLRRMEEDYPTLFQESEMRR